MPWLGRRPTVPTTETLRAPTTSLIDQPKITSNEAAAYRAAPATADVSRNAG